MPISRSLAARLRREAALLARQVRRARDGRPEGIHQTRVASRRLREMLTIAAAAADGEARSLSRDAKQIGRTLGPVRELDVSRAVWWEAKHAARWPAAVLTTLESRAEAERGALLPEVEALLGRYAGQELRRRVGRLADELEATPRDRLLQSALTRSVRDRAKALARAIEHAGTVYAVAPLHELRIAAKKFRYALELVHDLTPVRVAHALRCLEARQDLLGRLHDLQVVQNRLQASAAEPRVSREALGALTAAVTDLESECRSIHARFVAGAARLAVVTSQVRAKVDLALVQPQPRRMAAAPRVARPDRRPAVGSSAQDQTGR